MGLAVYCIQFLGWGDLPTLCVQVPVGAALYLAGSALLRLDSFLYLRSTAEKLLLHKNT